MGRFPKGPGGTDAFAWAEFMRGQKGRGKGCSILPIMFLIGTSLMLTSFFV